MFTQIRHQLLLSYLFVLIAILSVFAIAIRITFSYTLNQRLMARLETLATIAALEIEIDEEDEIEVEDEIIINSHQAVEWFDEEGELIEEQGDYVSLLPFDPQQSIQTQTKPYPIKSLTIPVEDYDTKIFIGYTRVSESTVELNKTLRSLDFGLAGSILAALILSALGGIWLTRKAMQPIEESFGRLKQFTADASHELRSPIMAIQSNAAVALKYPEGMRPTDAQKFEMIVSASEQMTRLTEDLLLLARADKVTKTAWEVINLSLILGELVKLYEVQAGEKKLSLQVQIADNLYLVGEQVLLKQLFTNLLQNAIYYTPEAGLIAIQANLINSQIVVKVKDTGVGIAPEDLAKVFERFWRAEKSRSYKAGKSGLGLAIAQAIAQQHHGLITVESQLDVGSCFIVNLPVKTS